MKLSQFVTQEPDVGTYKCQTWGRSCFGSALLAKSFAVRSPLPGVPLLSCGHFPQWGNPPLLADGFFYIGVDFYDMGVYNISRKRQDLKRLCRKCFSLNNRYILTDGAVILLLS